MTSPSQQLVKETAALQQKKHRVAQGLLLVEGRHPIDEALKAGLTLRYWFQLSGTGPDSLPQMPLSLPPFVVSEAQLKKMASTASVPPCLAVFDCPQLPPSANASWGDFVMVLDGLQDPGNVGTLIRSALAFGVDTVVLTQDSAEPYSPKVIRASAGLVFALPVQTLSAPAVLDHLTAGNYPLWVTTGHPQALPYRQANLRGRCALILGNEGRGVSDVFLKHPQAKPLTIPMMAVVESLNVGISGSILLAEAAAQRG